MKRALITGGVRGIGLAVAEAFRQKGYDVVCSYASDEEGAARAARLGFRVIRADVRDEAAVKALFDECKRVDVLVNNAGISLVRQVQDTTLSEWNDVFAVNTAGAFLCTRYALRDMLSRHGGVIVNISSVWGVVGGSCEVAYSASKAALIGFTKALAKEVGLSGIRVNCVAPGVIDTAMNDCFSAEEKQTICRDLPVSRMGTPEEVAQAVLFLAENEYITGQILGVDGGFGL